MLRIPAEPLVRRCCGSIALCVFAKNCVPPPGVCLVCVVLFNVRARRVSRFCFGTLRAGRVGASHDDDPRLAQRDGCQGGAERGSRQLLHRLRGQGSISDGPTVVPALVLVMLSFSRRIGFTLKKLCSCPEHLSTCSLVKSADKKCEQRWVVFPDCNVA